MNRNIALLALFAVAATSQAIVIDDFSTGALDLQLDPPSSNLSGNRVGSMVGGQAYHYIRFISNPDGNSARLRVNTTSGLQMTSNEDLVQTQSLAGYGGDALGNFGANDLNLNLSGDDRFRIHFRSADLPLTIDTVVFDAESGYAATLTTTAVAAGSNFAVDVMFSSLAGYDFSDLDVVGFYFNSAPSGDFSVTKIETVPEPATLAALAIGAGALLRRRRK